MSSASHVRDRTRLIGLAPDNVVTSVVMGHGWTLVAIRLEKGLGSSVAVRYRTNGPPDAGANAPTEMTCSGKAHPACTRRSGGQAQDVWTMTPHLAQANLCAAPGCGVSAARSLVCDAPCDAAPLV